MRCLPIKQSVLLALVLLSGCSAVDKTVDMTMSAVDAVTPDFIFDRPEKVEADEVEPTQTDAAAEKLAAIDPKVRDQYAAALNEMQQGEANRAIALFKEFVAEHPEYPGASLNLAKLQLRNADTDGAITTLQMCLSLHPDYAAANNQLGIIYREQGRFDEAAYAYRAAIDAQPSYALAYFNLAVLHDLYRQEPAVALDYYQQYRALLGPEAEDPEVDRWISDLTRRVGNTQVASKESDKQEVMQ